MKLRRFLYVYLALWLAFPCVVFIIWVQNYELLIGTTGTAFFIQSILNCIAAVCGITLAFLHYKGTEKSLKHKVKLAAIAIGVAFLLLCGNFFCSFFDGFEDYHSFTSPDGAHTIVLEESVSFTSEQIDLYERVNLFLIHPKEHIIIDYWCFPVCDGKYSLVWDGDTVTLSVFDGFGKNDTISVTLSGR